MDESSRMEPTVVRPRPSLLSRFRQNPRVAQQVLGGKSVILDYEGRRLLGLNENGTLIWSLLDGQRSLADVVRDVATAAGQAPASVEPDVLDFVADLKAKELVLEDVPTDRREIGSAP